MPGPVHQYAEVVAGSNYAPFPIVLRDVIRGTHIDLTGCTVTITIVDEATGEVIVQDGEALQNLENPYMVEYYLTDDQAAKITKRSTWIARWKVLAGNGRVFLSPTLCRIPVRPADL